MPIRRTVKYHCCKKCAEMYKSHTKRPGICPKCRQRPKTGTMMKSFIKNQKQTNGNKK